MADAHEQTPPAEPTDREQLLRQFTSVFEDIDAYLAETDEGKRDEWREQLEPLCVMRRIEYKLELAWGGPAYGFSLLYDPAAKEWVQGIFYWSHWFRYEEESLSGEELDKVVETYALDCLVE
jgi:hypothetical protein